MNKLLNLLKLGILFLGITVLLQNCEIDNDEVVEAEVSKNLDFKMERVTFKTIQEQSSISKSLSLIDKHLDKKKKTSNLSRKSAVQNDFTILTNDVIKIEKDSIITYTFQVEQNENSSGFQNFIIQQENNQFYYHLLLYSPNNDFINPSYDVKYTALNEADLDLSSIDLHARSAPAEEIDDGGTGNGDDDIQVCAVVTYEKCSVRGAANGHSPALQFDGSFCSGSATIVDLSYCPNYSYTGPIDTTNPVDTTPGDNTDTSNSSGGGSSGTSSASSNEVMTAPMLPNGDCPPGFTKNSEGICVAICTNDKTYNAATKKCECPDDKVEDSNGNCVEDDDCDTSKEDLKKVFPNLSDSDAALLASVINDKGKDFGIDSREDLWHFLSQAGHETGGFNTLNVTESTYWTTASKLALTYSKFTTDSVSASTNTNLYYANNYLQNSSGVANIAMCCKFGNGKVASGDGYKYRGRGLFQLTWKDNYSAFKIWYNNKYNPDIDPVKSPNIISTNDTLAILSGLWYYKTRVVDKITIDSTTTVSKVTSPINPKLKGLKDRKKKFQKVKDSINCK
jgi:putative chitinase